MSFYTFSPQPSPVNIELLQSELTANGEDVGLSAIDGVYSVTIFDATTTSTVQTVADAHDGTQKTAAQKIATVQELTIETAIPYFRQAMIDANGDGSEISNLYDQAIVYQGQNVELTAYMQSERTIYETAESVTISVATNQGKARYLRLFLDALRLWS